jgi:hypothetical protein
MSTNTNKLRAIGSPALSATHPEISHESNHLLGSLANEFREFLSEKNGFYAFDDALHVFPATMDNSIMGIEEWNSQGLWRSHYGFLMKNYFFFAEDVFGTQFCVFEDKIYSFDPETAEIEEIAHTFNEWAGIIIDDSDFLTGFPLANQWQWKNGKIPTGQRLLPKKPFVAGGEFSLENLYLLDAVTGMRARADFAKQIHNVKDGTEIIFSIGE